ncbi:MAG: polysaccharide deacetylase family protein [Gammaproteobacteria bacterium]|nr:polysaccharide deacetylase family protein [Gammaproteobacteria bacterium]MCF6230638.1 polysaccharide deacetylase family protein [Gammaproteobacteria bacterium]
MKIFSIAWFSFFYFIIVTPLWASSAVVLTYHRVGEDDIPTTNVTLEQFEQQLDYLQQHDFNVWPLSRILTLLLSGERLPERTIAITFDDAYLSVYTEAFPRLQAKGFPFTLFVATDPVDQGFRRYLSWPQLREMKAAGVTIANHSKSHAYMVRALAGETEREYQQRVMGEIENAQQRLMEELGDAPNFFAYPYGEYSTELMAIVKLLGYYGIGQHSGAISAKSNPQAVARFPINEHYSDMADFALKVNSYPLAIAQQSIENPIWRGQHAPQLVIALEKSVEGVAELACYASGQGRMDIEWLDRERLQFSIQAVKPLSVGRHRYTCTAPDSRRRYQWFSQLWVVMPSPDL